jgi:hypothetical protein
MLADSDSMAEVACYVHDLNRKWFHLGLALGLRYPTLKNIEATYQSDVGDYMMNMLLKWLKGIDRETTERLRGPPSWKSLAQALDCPLVSENQVARKIEMNHRKLEII